MSAEEAGGGVATEISEVAAETAEQRQAPAPSNHVGQAIRRKEDPRLITGRATYTDDMSIPGMLYAAIVRSTEAHARISRPMAAGRARSGSRATAP